MLTSPGPFLLVSVILYFGSGAWLGIYQGWPVRAGLAMIAAAYLPLVWQMIEVPDSEAPGVAILFMSMLPLPLFVIVAGGIFNVVRFFRRHRLLHSN